MDTKTEKNNETLNDKSDPNAKVNSGGWKNFQQKVSACLKIITVEPLLACYILPSVLASLAVQNLNLEKACRVNLKFGDEFCTNLSSHTVGNSTTKEVEVQALVAYMNAWRLPLQSVIPAFIVLFVGAWSDKTKKRKPYMLIPLTGEIASSLGLILCTYYFLQWPLEIAGVFEALPNALTGSWAMMFMAIFTHIADHTTPEQRTFRIGLVNVFISVAVPVGTALSGILLNTLGFYGVFLICIGIYICGFIVGMVQIKDLKPEAGTDVKFNVVEFFNPKLVSDTFMVIFKKRKLDRRIRTILLILVYILVSGPVHGTGQLLYLYARLRYKFDEVDFSIFSSYAIIMNLIGVLVAITIFTKILKMDDSLIGALAVTSKVLASCVYAFAPSKFWLYLGPLVEVIGGTAVIAMRSIATKLVETNETGKINSLFGVCDAIINVIYPPIFSAFYVATAEKFAGAFCVLAAFLTLPTIGIFIYMYKLQMKELEYLKKNDEKDEMENIAFENEVTSL